MAMEKEKILYVVEAMGGGVFTYIVDLANELVEDYDMYIAYATRRQTPENFKEYFDKRIRLIEVENFGRSINPAKDIKAFFEIRKIAKDINPDIIHLHSSKAGALGRWAFNGRKTPLFYTPHGYSFLMKNHSAKKRAIYKFIETICAKRHCTTISCSEGEHKESLKLTSNATYVDNGININALKSLINSVGKEKENEKFTVCTLGRICYQKNPQKFNEIALAMPDVDFVWIGDGEMRDELTAPNIKITGWAERKDALKYTMQSDAFILTSLWEGLPISLLESMYMKKPCIVSNVIGNRDVIHTGENGFVCDTTNDFINAIQTVMTEYSHTAEMVKTAYQQIKNIYNTRVMANRYEKIYENAMGHEFNREVVYLTSYNEARSGAVQLTTGLKKVAE